MTTNLPPAIATAVLEGRAILFLGAAASYDALISGARKKVTANDLRNDLADRFLGGKFKDRTLQAVADFARNESSLLDVQKAVRELFLPLQPNEFHKVIPAFRWKAIVTTNYDLVVERAYEQFGKSTQDLAPITRDGPALEDALRGQRTVPYLKLHGCINYFADVTVPIVLDSLEYSKFAHGRANLVSTFREWAINSPIIFCGYSLSDENIKQILFDVGDNSQARPQYLYVSPGLDEIEVRFWQTKRITAYPNTFEGFLNDIDHAFPIERRRLATFLTSDAPSFAKWVPSHEQASEALLAYLREEITHILPEQEIGKRPDARAFYSGLDNSFDPIYANLDARRQSVDDLLTRVVLDTLKSTTPKFFLVRGYAGCGKSVLTKRLCVETAGLLDRPLVIYVPPQSVIRTTLILELQRLVQGRLYVFLDDIAEYDDDLLLLLETVKKLGPPISIFASSRTNELNMYGRELSQYVTGEYEIGDLEPAEADKLLEKLSSHRILGPLQQYDEVDRRLFLEKFYNRQLLVALHEITHGATFEEIIVDEFERLIPREAQQIYLDICTLHQCHVTVRSGLVSRLSGIALGGLNEFLHGSLSKVVVAEYDHRVRDFVYRSRHDEIARMVFELAIPTPQERSQQLCRILSTMDLNYTSDRRAYFDLLKGRRLAVLFDEKILANRVFEAAMAADPPMSYINHQRAILELNHRTANLELAAEYLNKAEFHAQQEGHGSASIQHTRANLLRRKALFAKPVEKERFRSDARAILKSQLFKKDAGSYSETLYGRVLLDELKEQFSKESNSKEGAQTEATLRVMNELNTLIDKYLNLHPSDPQMTLLKAELLESLGKSPSAVLLLESYCKKHPNAGAVHKVYVETLIEQGRLTEAERLLRSAVIAAPADKPMNLMLAKLLIRTGEDANQEAILAHLRRSFTEGDTNYEARLYFARSNLLYGDLARGNEEFVALRKPFIQARDKVMNVVQDSSNHPRVFTGKLRSKQAGYGFVVSSELRFNVFVSRNLVQPDTWNTLERETGVIFNLGFTFRGPVALELQISDDLSDNSGIWRRN